MKRVYLVYQRKWHVISTPREGVFNAPLKTSHFWEEYYNKNNNNENV